MNLKSYLNLYQLLEIDTSTKEERRHFGLLDESLKKRPIEQLLKWLEMHYSKLKKPLMSEIFSSYLYGITLSVVLIAFFIGIFSGIALLNYNGHAPVNVVYFIAMVVFLPLITMTLTLFSMLKAHKTKSVLVHLAPAYWLEKILSLLPSKVGENLDDVKINPLLANWIVIKRSQFVALFFSLGLLLSLLAIVATKDIAFAWSTTLDITPEAFHRFLETLAMPWKTWLPSAVPSLELIEQSQYFRLGDRLSEEMVSHASKLGEWWKFLAISTLFYAIVLRFMMYLLSLFGLRRALKKSFLSLEGVSGLLSDMNEPIISSHAIRNSNDNRLSTQGDLQIIEKLDTSYDVVQGWAMSREGLTVLNDSMKVITPMIVDVGGTNTLREDTEIIHKSKGEVLLYVKAWEPPTMDFMDYLDELILVVDKVIVVPVGTVEESYKASDRFINIWVKKLSALESEKLWLKR
jgi:hypothetical protein